MNNNSDIYDFWGAPKKSTSTTSFNPAPHSETSGCTCASTGRQNCPIHRGVSAQTQTSLPDANQTQTPLPDYSQMSTRQVLDDKFRRGGFFPDEYAQKDEEEKQKLAAQQAAPSTFDNALKKAEYMSTAAQQGLSLGFADEIEGVMGGLGYGLASLNPNWNKRGEGFGDAAKRGYQQSRDTRRGNLQEGYEKAPMLTGAAEIVGSIATPFSRVLSLAKTAPLNHRALRNTQSMIGMGGVYGAGSTVDNTPQEYAKNIGVGMIGNAFGNYTANGMMGRGGDPLTRNIIEETLSSGAKGIYNRFSPTPHSGTSGCTCASTGQQNCPIHGR